MQRFMSGSVSVAGGAAGNGWTNDQETLRNLATAEEKRKNKSGGFQSMDLPKSLMKGIMQMGFNVPTPIQRKVIPIMFQGKDVVAMARTGSGKTAAYLIPMLRLLGEHCKTVGIRGLILSPTRELALQIVRHGIKLGYATGLRICSIVGGNSINEQFEDLAANPDIVVACPGRLLHIIHETSMKLTMMKSLVLDEADRLFEMGFQPQIIEVMKRIPDDCQRSLFSATMPSMLAEFTAAGLRDPAVVRLDQEVKLSEKLSHAAFVSRTEEKIGALIYVVKHVIPEGQQALIFVESKHHVEALCTLMAKYDFACGGVHGGMDQEARHTAVYDFAKRKSFFMVVTDVAARGIDLPLLDNVINFSFPAVSKLFIHRVGRVARAGRTGSAFSLLTVEDMPYYCDLMNFVGIPPRCKRPEAENADDPFAEPFDPANGCYGRLPEQVLQIETDYVRRCCEEDADLRGMMKVIRNAHDKYSRTRTKPTTEGCAMAKKVIGSYDHMPVHPMLVDRVSAATKAADSYIHNLRTFKSKESVLDIVNGEQIYTVPKYIRMNQERAAAKAAFEAEQKRQYELEAGKSGAKAASTTPAKPLTLAERMMQQAKANLGDTGNAPAPKQLGDDEDDAHRDAEYFLASEPNKGLESIKQYSLKDATLDITPDSGEGIQKARLVHAWDKHKKRYMRMAINDAKALVKGIKNEAGKAIDFKDKVEMYSKWTKQSNMRIQDVGEIEDESTSRMPGRKRRRDTGEDGDEAGSGGEEEAAGDSKNKKKVNFGRKLKKLPKDGRIRTFDEMRQIKAKKEKEKSRQQRNQKHGKRKKK